MDVGDFSDDNFDAIGWINKTYKNAENTQNKEAFVSSLVTKLQLYVQQVNSAVEETSQQFFINLPKVMKDAQNLQNEALTLRTKMTEVQSEIAQVQSETGTCMENLEKLDNLKTKLQTAKQGLQESDGWGRLTSELEDLLEHNDVKNACEKLNSLQKSLAAQFGLPGQNERENQVEGFKNRLEALCTTNVVHSFSTGDIEQSKKFYGIFLNMGRINQLTQYYRTVQKNMLERHWIELTDLAENSGSNRFLREFYDILLEHWQKQVKWCTQVFGISGHIEPILVQCELLGILQPTRETAVMNALKRTTDKLSVLTEISNANIYFGNTMLKYIEMGTTKLSIEHQKLLSKSIYNYFNIFIGQYAMIEQQNLTLNLTNLNLTHSTVAESIRSLGSSNSKIIQWCEQAVKRCADITQNCALAPLILVLNSFVKTYLEKYKKTQNQLRASKTIEQDWNLLQTCIQLLQNIGDFKLNLENFETNLSIIIIETDEKFNHENDYDFSYKLLGKRELNDFKKLINSIKELKSKSLLINNDSQNDNNKLGIFSSVKDIIYPICIEVHDITLASIFTPIENHLKVIEPTDTLNSSGVDLPDYSYAPQEYITQVGQYLLTLPQHLEPLLLSPAPTLKAALELCDVKYSRNVPSADILLSLIADECCAMYQEQIAQILNISMTGSKQLATDIEYLGSVLEELGLTLGSYLQQIAALLRAPAENYLLLSSGCDPKLVTAIRQMRNLISE